MKLIINNLLLFCGFILLSCGPSEAEFNSAAQETCQCVESMLNNPVEQGKTLDLYYAICTLETEKKYNLDVQSELFKKAIENHCKWLLKTHIKLTKNAITF